MSLEDSGVQMVDGWPFVPLLVLFRDRITFSRFFAFVEVFYTRSRPCIFFPDAETPLIYLGSIWFSVLRVHRRCPLPHLEGGSGLSSVELVVSKPVSLTHVAKLAIF